MSWPSNTMLPESAKYAPATAFRSVLLPEPLGPIRPWNVPARTSMSTPSSARRVRNVLVTPRISSSAMMSLSTSAVGPDALAVADQQAQNSLGLEQHHAQQHQAEDDRPDPLDGVDVGQHVGQDFDGGRAQHRADQRARAAEQAVEHGGGRQARPHVAGADEALMVAVEHTAQPRDHAGQREHQRLEELYAIAEESQPLLVLPHARQHQAELRLF